MLWGYSEIEIIAGFLIMVLATISLIATLVTLWLIHDMNRWNGYMLLIFNLTLCQAFYDISFYFLLAFRNDSCFAIFKFLSTFAGLAVTLWTNIISFVLFYIVLTMKSFHIQSYFKLFFGSIMTISCLIAALEVGFYVNGHDRETSRIEHDYYYFRIFSILFNIFIHCVISFQLWRMGLMDSVGTVTGPKYINIKAINDPLKTLSARLKYYPIVQILTWVGAAWYEFEYGFTVASFDSEEKKTTLQLICIYFDVICSPSAGLGFFIIFLVVQPTAYAHLVFKLKHMFNLLQPQDTLRNPHHRAHANHNNNSDYLYDKGDNSSGFRNTNSSLMPQHQFAELLIAGNGSGNNSNEYHPEQHLSGDDDRQTQFDELDEEELAQQMEDKYRSSSSGLVNHSNNPSSSFMFYDSAANLFSGNLHRTFSSMSFNNNAGASGRSGSTGGSGHTATNRLHSDEGGGGGSFY